MLYCIEKENFGSCLQNLYWSITTGEGAGGEESAGMDGVCCMAGFVKFVKNW